MYTTVFLWTGKSDYYDICARSSEEHCITVPYTAVIDSVFFSRRFSLSRCRSGRWLSHLMTVLVRVVVMMLCMIAHCRQPSEMSGTFLAFKMCFKVYGNVLDLMKTRGNVWSDAGSCMACSWVVGWGTGVWVALLSSWHLSVDLSCQSLTVNSSEQLPALLLSRWKQSIHVGEFLLRGK